MPLYRKPRINVQDEGTLQGRVGTVNFAGAGVSAAVSGDTATATISGGGGGGASATTVEIDLGTTPIFSGRFTITDASIGTSSKVLVWQAPGPYTGKGTRADEAALQPIRIIGVEPLAGSCIVSWETPPAFAALDDDGDGAVNTMVVNVAMFGPSNHKHYMRRLGRVKGNVKFSYVIFS